MPQSDTWPGGSAMESLSKITSAGSCDSVISVNSACSEDSMEHLSAEERACLMYLEETIEALEVQEDSGISNDEPDSAQLDKRTEDVSGSACGDRKPCLTSGPPGASPKVPSGPALDVGSNGTSGPESTSTEGVQTSVNPTAELAGGSKSRDPQMPSPDDGSPADAPGSVSTASCFPTEVDLGLIPPPSDFMDDPGSPPEPEAGQDLPPPAEASGNSPVPSIASERLSYKSSAKAPSVGVPLTPELPTNRQRPVPLVVDSVSPMGPEAAELKTPPAVAPKPKKLPANIILKSFKSPMASSDGNPSAGSGDRLLPDPQRVRMEALQKLGLLKSSSEDDNSPVPSPKLSPKTRGSWSAPLSPSSPAASLTPPSTPSYTRAKSSDPTSFCLPAPPAFCDPVKPPPSDRNLAGVATRTPPLSPLIKKPGPPKVAGAASPAPERYSLGVISGNLTPESSPGGSHQQSLHQLRNNRPRPSSMGSGREFSSGRAEGLQANFQRSLPGQTANQHSGDSQKLPRSQGISVLICPRAENEGDRREALKKLGLLRD